MDHKQEKAMQKKKERERENVDRKEHEREETRNGTFPRHVWFFTLGAVLVLFIVLAWTFLL